MQTLNTQQIKIQTLNQKPSKAYGNLSNEIAITNEEFLSLVLKYEIHLNTAKYQKCEFFSIKEN